MSEKLNTFRIKRKTILYIVAILIALASVTPVLADYLGPDRTVTQMVTTCKVYLYKCQYVASKDLWKYKVVSDWLCSNESQPWTAYSSKPSPLGCYSGTDGDEYWEKVVSSNQVTTTYPPATISGSLQSCTLNNGWCNTAPQLSLNALEPVAGYNIIAIEGTLNGQNFACADATCSVPLFEGDNSLTYWALSSWGDSSAMGTLAAKVDSQLPVLTGAFSGTSGSNGWYISPVSFNGSASDATSGLASFTCTLDGNPLSLCGSISINEDGEHTLILNASDNAGNVRTWNQDISIDTLSPILKAALSGTIGSNSWYTAASLNASATDPVPGSDISALEYNLDKTSWVAFPSSGVLTLPDGKHSLDIRALDNAGHVTSSSKSFWLDSMGPEIALNATGTLGSNNWYTTGIDLSASVSDDTSGVDVFEYSLDNGAWTSYTSPLTIADGSHSISFWAQDNAGLATQVERVYQVDTRLPQIAGSITGTPGANGWYVSDVVISASVADPLPGSGIDTFTYNLDGASETAYASALTIPDGQHTIRFNAQDKAGLTYSVEQTIDVDTVPPDLTLYTALPNWVKNTVTLSGTAGDNGSGIAKVEISTDGGQTWQTVSGTTSWSYEWDTHSSSNGTHNIHVRVTDKAGLITEKTLNTSVDNQAPNVSLPNSWFQWETVRLDVWDDHSGLSEARLEISDPNGRWPKRVISLDSEQFPLDFKWDRRFGDGTIAPAGTYDVEVIALDQLGNTTQQDATVKVLLSALPAGPTSTPQPYSRSTSTSTPSATPTFISSPTATQTAVVSVFGGIQPTAQATSTPTAVSTPRATPTQTSVLDWLESIFSPNENSQDQVTEIAYSDSEAADSPSDTGSNVLWGAVAAAMVGSVTSYAEEERKKKKEDEAKEDLLKAEKRANREKLHARKMQKLEEKWAQEKAWQQAAQPKPDFGTGGMDAKVDRIDKKEEEAWIASQEAIRKKQEERRKAREQEELKAAMAAYYSASRAAQTTTTAPAPAAEEKPWWEKAWDWVDDHQTEIALGVGVAVGVGAIILSGGLAAPLVALGWMAGAAVVAEGVVAAGTIILNAHYERPWYENLVRNVAVSGIAAMAVTGAGFLFQAVAGGMGTYCATNPNVCSHIEPVLNAVDWGEEAWLTAKLAYQTYRQDPAAADTALELQMEHMDGGMPGNSVEKELKQELGELSEEALQAIEQYGDEVIPLLLKYRGDALEVIQTYGDEGIAVLQKYGDEAIDLVMDYGASAVKVLSAVDPGSANKLLGALDDDVLDYAIQQGPDAVAALSHWSVTDLEEHGTELALRADKDAKVLADVKKLIALGKLDPQNLTQEQLDLINQIAANSTYYAENGQVVIGKWVGLDDGFLEVAGSTGSVHYSPHPDMWNLLKELGGESQSEAAWLVNKQVIQNGINKGLPFEYTLSGVPEDVIENEHNAIEAIFSGQTEGEVKKLLQSSYLPARMKELQELKNAGYELTFDSVKDSYILVKP